MFKESSKSRGVFRTQASIYDGAFLWINLTDYYFCNKSCIIDVRCSIIDVRLGLGKYWNFQSEAKLEQIITIAATHGVFLLSL